MSWFTLYNFQPFIWCEDEGAKGIDADIIAELFQRLGRTYTIRSLPWKRALGYTQDGDADGTIAAFKTPEREAYAQFLEQPLHFSTYSVFVKKGDEFSFETVEGLYGKTIGINAEYSVSPTFDAAVQAGQIVVEEVKETEQNTRKLLARRIDAMINNRHVTLYTAKTLGLSEGIVPLSRPVQEPRLSYLMISHAAEIEQKAELIQQLNQVLNEMWQDGTVDTITS